MQDGLRRNRKHQVWPNLVRMESAEAALTLYNPGHGTSLDVEAESVELVEELLAAFATPTTLNEYIEREPDVSEELLTLLVRSAFIVEEAELAFLEHGFLRPVPNPVGPLVSFSDLHELEASGSWAVVGVPSDMGALGAAGARHGPAEIRKVVNGPLLSGEGDVLDYDLNRLYREVRPSVIDLGDVEPDGGRLDHVGARLSKVVRELLQRGMRPLCLGGDHSLTHFVLSETLQHVERLSVIHFDAHHDLGPSRFVSHANVFGVALESPRVVEVLQIGLRGLERLSPFATRVPAEKRRVITSREAMRGGALRALEALPRDVPYYLSFDIDCIDAALAPETGTPAFGGLSFELATELVDYIARHFELVGADFVEVSQARSPVNAAALMAASLLQRCLLGPCAFEPLSTDVYTLR